MDTHKKRKRSANWDSLEKNLLRGITKEFAAIIENKNTDTNTNKAKHYAWRKIAERFNELNSQERTIAELKQQWRQSKAARKKLTNLKKEFNGPGGGQKPPSPDPLASNNEVLLMIPREIKVESNNVNCDGSVIIQEIEECDPTPIATEETDPEVVQEIEEAVNAIQDNQIKERRLRNMNTLKRKLPHVNQTSDDRNKVLMECIKKEHELKICQMRESHEWAKEEHQLKMKNLQLQHMLLQAQIYRSNAD